MTCQTPVALFVYKRPDLARQVFERIRAAKPSVFILVSDGPRNPSEIQSVRECQSLAEDVDWDCQVISIFSEKNLGCRGRFFSALEMIFNNFERLIVLEDDCLPEPEFFSFCDWALDFFEHRSDVFLLTGTNFGPQLHDLRNGFSRYLNIWGWASWRSRWRHVNPHLGVADIRVMRHSMRRSGFRAWERLYWSEVFKHAILSRGAWDFYIQEAMLRTSTLCVYPAQNLIRNIGFDARSTHMTGAAPDYVLRTAPNEPGLMASEADPVVAASWPRDRSVAREIWFCKPTIAYRLKITNVFRYFKA